ncbi:MAG: hypothetical protein WBD10_00730 [Acidobacteriaceae bacterium]
MKDELREFESDATSRKTATDWLMKVISGKKPINLHLNGSEAAEDPEGAVAVEELPGMPEPVSSKRAGWAEAKRETAAAEFTAEDLCGAPAVPVVRVFPAARDEITADDVCWVPVEQRLKPEPAAPKLKIVQPQERELPAAELREPKRAEPGITTEEISRDPAPFVVEPIWNGFAAEPDAPDAEQEITEADIARDWVLKEMSPPPRETRDGAVLPFSFKVIQTTGTGSGAAEQAEMPEAKASAAAGLVEAGDAVAVGIAPEMISAEAAGTAEEAASAAEPRLDALDAPARIEIATEIVAEMPETIAAEPAAEIPVIEPDAFAVGQVAAMPVEGASELVEMPVEAASEGAAVEGVTAPAELDVETPTLNEALEESAAEAEIETVLHEAEVGEEKGAEQGSVTESVFARESFWEEAAASGAARGEGVYEKPVLQKVKWPQSLPEEMAEIGQRPEGWVSAWKTLLRLGSVLPWVARALPMIEAGGLAEPQASSGGLQEIRQDVSGLRLVQYEIRTTVQDHSMQLKRMEEQLGRVRESVESKASESGDLAESVRSMTRLVRLASMGLGGLLLVLVVLEIVMLAHGR